MDMPTTCQQCLDVVEFNDMVDVAKCGASIFLCEDCAEDMDESKLADELQKEANIERIKQVVERVNQQKAIENSDNKEVDFDSLNFYGDDFN